MSPNVVSGAGGSGPKISARWCWREGGERPENAEDLHLLYLNENAPVRR